MRTAAKLAAAALAVVTSAVGVGCAGDQDTRRAKEPTSAPAFEPAPYSPRTYMSPSPSRSLDDQRDDRGEYYGSERGAKNPGGDIDPHGGKTPGSVDSDLPNVSPRGIPCPTVPPGSGHGNTRMKPGSLTGDDARTTDCPDWQESDEAKPGGRGTIQ